MYGVTGAAIKSKAKRLGINLPKKRRINPCECFSKPRYKELIICPICNKQLKRRHLHDKQTCSRECSIKLRSLNIKKKKNELSKLNKWDGIERVGMWKVEKTIKSNGYLWAKCPQHPNAFKDGYVLAHRIVMENHLGRILRSNEIVHHIDGNKSNNDISNLMILTQSQHSKLHSIEREVEGRGIKTYKKNIAIGKKTKDGKFEDYDIREIRDQYSSGITCAEIARSRNVSRRCINNIVNGCSYKWVT